jgi:catechol 2,3-dioxygenase-like lactoylglutathione lyase family enzyme
MGLSGINHITFISGDIDALKDFYKRVFDADCVLDENVEHGPNTVRQAFIDIGSGVVLHPFEMPSSTWLGPMPMFNRGRIDHLALNAASREDFNEYRERLIKEGSADGTVTDFGAMLSVFFRDPDGMEAEVCWTKS